MNEIVHNFLLAGERFIPKLHLKQPGFTYSACRTSDIFHHFSF